MREHFVWGAATSAYQIEGGRYEGDKEDSIWDQFSDRGLLADPGDVTCDHYHRWPDDVGLLADLGVDAYRLSLAWTRIVKDGSGEANQAGLDFYGRLIDGLLEAGITPYVTLYHWDLPAVLQQRYGGWQSRDCVDDFVHYVQIVAASLGDRVTNWITHNEPFVAAMLGYQQGLFAPGVSGWESGLAAAHHILLSHGMATNALREAVPNARVGIALDCRPCFPASDNDADHDATRHFDGFRNRWFFDPVFGKGYPNDMIDDYRAAGRLDHFDELVHSGDLETIAAPIDFLGVNYYTSKAVTAATAESEEPDVPAGEDVGPGHTEMGWSITPNWLTVFLRRVHQDYAPASILITENGASYSDGPNSDGVIADLRRIDYVRQHLDAVGAARRQGVPVDGYFVWSLLDNLEWTAGFTQRFGIVWVDQDSLERIPKQSWHWYRERIASGDAPGDRLGAN